jgi:hypothetical protein
MDLNIPEDSNAWFIVSLDIVGVEVDVREFAWLGENV